jgi:pyruvate,water dikinase
MKKLIKKFNEISISDTEIVGGKNSSLCEMFTQLSQKGIRIPDGFATTAFAFRNFLEANHLNEHLQQLMQKLNKENFLILKKLVLMQEKFY